MLSFFMKDKLTITGIEGEGTLEGLSQKEAWEFTYDKEVIKKALKYREWTAEEYFDQIILQIGEQFIKDLT